MLESKTLLHTARFESFGFVLAEAAMSGCSVVSTPVGAAATLGASGSSLHALIHKTSYALDQPLPEAPFTPFTMEETARRYLHLYHST
jgi:glycosyltransferase involved in cell wall biosynthesis